MGRWRADRVSHAVAGWTGGRAGAAFTAAAATTRCRKRRLLRPPPRGARGGCRRPWGGGSGIGGRRTRSQTQGTPSVGSLHRHRHRCGAMGTIGTRARRRRGGGARHGRSIREGAHPRPLQPFLHPTLRRSATSWERKGKGADGTVPWVGGKMAGCGGWPGGGPHREKPCPHPPQPRTVNRDVCECFSVTCEPGRGSSSHEH